MLINMVIFILKFSTYLLHTINILYLKLNSLHKLLYYEEETLIPYYLYNCISIIFTG